MTTTIYIVFTGREDFGEATIATLDDLYGNGNEQYAVFSDADKADKFALELRKKGHLRPWQILQTHPFEKAYARDFVVVE